MHLVPHPLFACTHDGRELSTGELESQFPEVASFIAEWNSSSEIVELQTSGSTGKPKVVAISKAVMAHSARTTIEYLRLAEGGAALLALPPRYIAGKMMLVRAILGGFRIELANPSTDVLMKTPGSFDFAALIPAQVAHAPFELNRIAKTIIGGAPVESSLLQQLIQVNTEVFETYGMTETVSHVALKKIRPQFSSSFEALRGIHFSVDSESRLRIHARDWGYETLKTTDVVDFIDEKHFIWKGRADFVINSGGVKIHPELVEPLLTEWVDKEVRIVGVPHPQWGTVVHAVVQGELPERRIQSLGDLVDLSAYARPKHWWSIQEWPLTPNSKLNRLALQQQIQERTSNS